MPTSLVSAIAEAGQTPYIVTRQSILEISIAACESGLLLPKYQPYKRLALAADIEDSQ